MDWCTANLLQSFFGEYYYENGTESQKGYEAEGGEESNPVYGGSHKWVDHDTNKEIEGHVNGV